MRKSFYCSIAFICLSFFSTSCSTDGTGTETETTINQLASRTAAESYPEFTSLLEGKFGRNYDIKNAEVMFDVYYVSKVFDTSTSPETFKGYFIETPDRNVVYIEENRTTARLMQYDYVDNRIVELDFSLTLVPNYPQFGTPPNNGAITNGFWGWGPIVKGSCENNKRALYREYYVAWVNTGIQKAEEALDGQPLTEPCGEPVLGED